MSLEPVNFSTDFCKPAKLCDTAEEICGKEADRNDFALPFIENGSKSSSSKPNDGLLSDDLESSKVDLSQIRLESIPIDCVLDIQGKDDDDNDNKDYQQRSTFMKVLTAPIQVTKHIMKYEDLLTKLLFAVLLLGITTYMVAACILNFNQAIPLLVIWCLVVGYNIYVLLRDRFGDNVMENLDPLLSRMANNMFRIKWVFVSIAVAGLAVWILLDTSKRPNQLISGVGYLVFLYCLFISSKYPDQVIWRPVLWGLLIQICFGMLILRTQAGFDAFNWLGNLAQTFINYVDVGAKFVFGPTFMDHMVAFKVLPIVIYFGAFISVLYYLGAMQWLILKIAWLMQISLGTSATESMVAAGNIFVGLAESPLLIRPYIHDLTTSELHAVMTAGFGTIAGSVLGAYLSFGIKAAYIITASVMAAPCALAVSKLIYPETKKSKFTTFEGLILAKTDQRNIIEAAFVGASSAIPLVLNICANLIAFLSLLAAVNGFLGWFGGLLNYPQLSFEVMCSYVFMPITFLMGIEWADCFKAAELIGTKIFLNDFIAYEELARMITNRDNGTLPHDLNGEVQWVTERTEAIVTYALCGFANFGSMGITLGGLGSMVPQRQSEMAKIVLRALFGGVFVGILNACIAGFLYVPRPIDCTNIWATTNWVNTGETRLFECCSRATESWNCTIVAYNCCNLTNFTNPLTYCVNGNLTC